MGTPSKIKYPLSFKAAILEETNHPLVLHDVTFHGPLEPGQVLVKVHYSGICGKQIEEILGSAGTDSYLPHLLGHEGSGVVAEIGPQVTKVEPGDAVVMHWLKGSGAEAPTPKYHQNGTLMNAGRVTTFNEYAVISENRVTPIPKTADLKDACLLGCAVTTGLGVVLNDAKLSHGDSMAVFGCGGVGLSVIQGGRIAGAHPIIAVDKNPDSLELALELGASHTILWSSDSPQADGPDEQVRQITGGVGCHAVMVAVGAPGVIEMAASASSVPGSVYLVGVPPLGATISVAALDIHKGRTFTGSHGGGCVPERDIPAYLKLHEEGKLKLGELISETISLNQINSGIDSLLTGVAGRCVVAMV